MATDESIELSVQGFLVDALAISLTRRMAERIVADVGRNRAGLALPSDAEGLLALVQGDLAQATFLRVGSRAVLALAELENRVAALAVVPVEAWSVPRVRLVFVGRSVELASHLAREIGAHPVVRIEELHELLIALDEGERTLVLVDQADATLDAATMARFVPDFPNHVLTFVAASSPAAREAYLSTGAAFRATLRSEPLDHPDTPQLLRDLVRGGCRNKRGRSRGGSTSTTTGPARAA